MKPSLTEKVWNVLASSPVPLSSRKLAKLTGAHYQNVDSALTTLRYRGLVQAAKEPCPTCNAPRLFFNKCEQKREFQPAHLYMHGGSI